MTAPNKIDSNNTGLRFAVEKSLKVLPFTANGDAADPTWFPLEPNSYGDFGAKINTVARRPINPSRQRQKGVVTDLEANANFQSDITQLNHLRFMQGFLFAAAREKATSAPLNAAATAITAVASADNSYAIVDAIASKFVAGTLFVASGFTNAANNGLKKAAAPTVGKVITTGLTTEAAPPASAYLQVVGFEFPAADVQITMTGGLPTLVATATVLTTLGLIPGEWIYLGGDVANSAFAVNKGFARVKSVTATVITFDKVSWAAPANESGAGKSIRIFTGTVVKNEDDPTLIVRQSYTFERTLGNDGVGTAAEYVVGAVSNELTIDMKGADKATMELNFVACDSQPQDGSKALKAGSRPSVTQMPAFNTSSDVKRIQLAVVDASTSTPSPVFAYCTDVTLKIGNAISGAKAIGVLGNFDVNAGMLDVGGSLTAYFQNVAGIQAVRNNSDVTFDMVIVKNNAGLVFDLPLIGLGNGLPAIEADKPITLPLDTMAAQSSFGHTMMYVNFPYLPNLAAL